MLIVRMRFFVEARSSIERLYSLRLSDLQPLENQSVPALKQPIYDPGEPQRFPFWQRCSTFGCPPVAQEAILSTRCQLISFLNSVAKLMPSAWITVCVARVGIVLFTLLRSSLQIWSTIRHAFLYSGRKLSNDLCTARDSMHH